MVGLAFDLDGVNAAARVAVPTGLPLGNQPRTLALWFKTSRNLSVATESALFQYGANANGQMFGLITSGNAPGKLYFFGYNQDTSGATTLLADTWYHAAVAYDGTNATLFLNGKPDGFRAVNLNTVLNADGLTIGSRPGGSKWQGQFDEVMLFDRALSTNEIVSSHDASSRGVCRAMERPRLRCSAAGDQLKVEWISQFGWSYQLQSATNLSAPARVEEGAPFVGTGDVLTTNLPLDLRATKFFRLHKR